MVSILGVGRDIGLWARRGLPYGRAVAKQHKQHKQRRRRRPSVQSPVVLTGTVPGYREVPRRARWLSRPLAGLVALLPEHELSKRGRAKANTTRLVVGGLAILLVTLGREQLALGVLGGVVALSLLALPLPDVRKRRWLAGARALSEPRRLVTEVPATVTYDGTKIVIEQGGRTWKSLRPRQSPLEVVVGVDEASVTLGLVKIKGKRRDHIWFRAPRGDVRETYDPLSATPGDRKAPVDEAMTLGGDSWALLHEVLWDPTTGGLPRPRGPARA